MLGDDAPVTHGIVSRAPIQAMIMSRNSTSVSSHSTRYHDPSTGRRENLSWPPGTSAPGRSHHVGLRSGARDDRCQRFGQGRRAPRTQAIRAKHPVAVRVAEIRRHQIEVGAVAAAHSPGPCP